MVVSVWLGGGEVEDTLLPFSPFYQVFHPSAKVLKRCLVFGFFYESKSVNGSSSSFVFIYLKNFSCV